MCSIHGLQTFFFLSMSDYSQFVEIIQDFLSSGRADSAGTGDD